MMKRLFRLLSSLTSPDLASTKDLYDGLAADEARFLEAVRPLGLDWKTSCKTLSERHGQKQLEDGMIEVNLPPSAALTDDPLQFRFHFRSGRGYLCPEYLRASYDMYEDSRRNFATLEEQLIKRLGEGVRSDNPTELIRVWSLGIFKVELKALPPDMRSEWVTKGVDFNPVHYNPVTVTLSSHPLDPYPRKDLEWIPDVLSGPDGSLPDNIVKLRLSTTSRAAVPLSRHTFRNVSAFQSVLDPYELAVWRSSCGDEIGVSSAWVSVVVPKKSFGKLILLRLMAGTEPEGSELSLSGEELSGTEVVQVIAAVLLDDSKNGLDEIAGQISEHWKLPLEVHDRINNWK